MKKIRVIITGTTGMVGEGVLLECLKHPQVEAVLSVSRRHPQRHDPKLRSIVLGNFSELPSVSDELKGYDACLFCLGVSSVGMKEPEYTSLTYDLTTNFAKEVKAQNPDLTFCYISGASTDSTENGRSMWVRVKGRTENDLIKMFSKAYMFRPGYMRPTQGMQHALKFYKYVDWMYPLLRRAFPGFVTTLAEVGQAMINAVLFGYEKKVLEIPDIVKLAKNKP